MGVNLAEQDFSVGHHQAKGFDFLLIFVHKHRSRATKDIVDVALQYLQIPLDVFGRLLR